MITPAKNIQTLAEFKYKPIMTAWFAWKNGGTGTRYSFELRNTLKKIRYRGELPHIDFHYGFQSLVNLIENHHKGKYNTAIIYGLRNENDEVGVVLRKYVNDQLVIEADPDFNQDKWCEKKDRLMKKIYVCARNAKIVTSVLNKEILE